MQGCQCNFSVPQSRWDPRRHCSSVCGMVTVSRKTSCLPRSVHSSALCVSVVKMSERNPPFVLDIQTLYCLGETQFLTYPDGARHERLHKSMPGRCVHDDDRTSSLELS